MKKKPLLSTPDETPIVEDPPTPAGTVIPAVIIPAKLAPENTSSELVWSKANKITNDEQLQATTNHRIEMDAFIKQADDMFEGEGKPQTMAYRLWKSICDMHNGVVKDLKAARDLDNQNAKNYVMAEKLRREQEAADAQRLIDEADARKRKELEDKAAKAKKPETQQKYQEQAAAIASPTVIAREAPKVAGMNFVPKWKSKITDEKALFEFICANKRRDLIDGFNTKVLDAMAVSLKKEMGIPGVEAFEDLTPTKTR